MTGLHLHYSNALEELIAPLAEEVSHQREGAPLEPAIVIVPNRVIEEFLKLRLCERLGVAANLRFPFLRAYLGQIVTAVDSSLSVLEIDDLQVLLFERLRKIADGRESEYEPVRAYVRSGSGSEADREIRTLQLAGQVAHVFREYSISRRTMLAGWRRGTQLNDPALAATERWQRALWRSVFDDNRAVRAELLAEAMPRRMLLPDAFEALEEKPLAAALPRALHVFGIGYAGSAFAEIFARIARLAELHVYALNPCAEFWEDLDIPEGTRRARMIRRGAKIGADLNTEDDPFNIASAGDTPALRLWSRPGREYVRMLNELSECDFDSHFVHRAQAAGASLLHRIQEDVLIREPERAPAKEGEGSPDASIRFLACPGVRREAEIVANEIWSMVTATPDLRFHQVAVAVADNLWPEYQPHLETAFAQIGQLPVNIVNRRFASESRVAQALAMLLKLPLGNLGRYAMLHLLTHPAICGADAEADAAQWARWCEALGVFFGADAKDFENTYLPKDVFHWDQGLIRLSLGVFMAGERSADASFFKTGTAEYLPMALPQEDIGGAARMLRLTRSLIADAVEIRARRLTLADWARLLTEIISTYVVCADAVDERVRDWCIEAIESIAAEGVKGEPVPYQIAHEFASAKIAEAEKMRGRFSETGVVVGPLSALRSIPFRVIFLAGLNESRFPERPHNDPLDLRLVRRKAGDVSPTERDRYAFLETLLAARERLVLSYVARNAQTGESMEPSTVVHELQFILRGYLDEERLKALTIKHPVSRYDFRYFKDLAPEKVEDPLHSFDPAARAGAKMAALRADLQKHCGADFILPKDDSALLENLSEEAGEKLRPALPIIRVPAASSADAGAQREIRLPLSAIRRYLECPIQGAAQYALGMAEDEYDAAEEDQDEPLAQSAMDRAVLLREVFRHACRREDRAVDQYRREFRIAQVGGRAPAGVFQAATERSDLNRLQQWFKQAGEARAGDLSRWIDVRIGHAGEFARADCLIDEIDFEVEDPNGAPVKVRVYGSAGFFSRDLAMGIHGILGKKNSCKDFLRLFVAAIAFAAARRLQTEFRAIVVGAGEAEEPAEVRRLAPLGPEIAVEYLRSIARELLYGKNNHCFIPIDAVDEIMRRRRRDPGADAIEIVESVRDNDFKHCASDFGPVRNARRFQPPTPELIEQIIAQRFLPIAAIFAGEDD